MGIRFACHICGKKLNIKSELAGKRGVCPSCSSRFRIPTQDSEHSLPLETAQTIVPSTTAANKQVVTDKQVPESDSGSALIFDGASTWYVRPPSGGQYGPASEDLLHQWIGEGRVAATALLWRDGWPEWREAIGVLPQLRQNRTQDSAAEETFSRPTAAGPPVPTARPQPDRIGPQAAASLTQPTLEILGDPRVGSRKQSRSFRRLFWIVLLCLIAAALLGLLIWLMNR